MRRVSGYRAPYVHDLETEARGRREHKASAQHTDSKTLKTIQIQGR